MLATFGCSAVLTSSKLSTTRLLMTDTASSLAFWTRPESSRTLARAVSKALLPARPASELVLGAAGGGELLGDARQLLDGLTDQLGLTAQHGLGALDGDAVGGREGLDVLALRGDGGLEIEHRRLAVHEQLAEVGGGLVEVAIELGEIGNLEAFGVEINCVALAMGLSTLSGWVAIEMLHCTILA